MEVEHFEITINENETIAKRERDYIGWKGDLKHGTTICKSRNTKEDIYNKRISMVVSILKTLRFNRRIVRKICDILLEEDKRINKRL